MMQLYEFDSYEQYYAAQVRADSRKTRRSSAQESEIKKLVEYLSSHGFQSDRGICHGARHGVEVEMLRNLLPKSRVIGTDLLYEKPGLVVKHDFHDRRKEWERSFDFLYSNALDHARYPDECLKVWMEQLQPEGVAFIQWTLWHVKIRGGDCFGAALHEYISMLNEVGNVKDLIYCNSRKTQMTLIVASPIISKTRRRNRINQ